MIIEALLTILLVILIHWLAFLYRRPPGLPPGPLPLPFFGSAWVFFGREDFKVFAELRQHYGGAVSIFSGCWLNGLVVIVLDWDIVVELANSVDIADRPFHLNELRGVSEGIVWAQYDRAKRRRKFLTQAFKTVGLATPSTTPAHIADELTRLFAYIDDQKNKPFDPNDAITEAMTSCLLLKTYGHRFDLKDEVCARLFAGGRGFFEASIFEMLMLPQLKFLRYFLRDKMAESERYMEATMTVWLRDEISKRQSVLGDECQIDGPDLVDLYMTSESTFENFNGFVRSLVDIFLGSMDTNVKSVCWVLFYLAHMPDEQERLFKEIESVVPSIDYPQIKHREQLNRVVAFIEESARYSCMALVGFPRRCEKSVSFRCVSNNDKKEVFYSIPKNGTVWFSAYTNQFDEGYWLDPHNFRVERWLKPDGADAGNFRMHTHNMPFGIGRRVCVGEQVARNLQFLFVSAFIQRFKWRLAEHVPFDDYRVGLTRIPPQHKLIFSRRD